MVADGVRSHSSNCEIQHVLADIGIAHFKKQHVKEVFITCCKECNIYHHNLFVPGAQVRQYKS